MKREKVLGNPNYNSQIRQLRILAEAALTRYDIGNARLTLLAHHRSALFRVDSQVRSVTFSEEEVESEESAGAVDLSEKHKDARYVIRLCDPSDVNQEMLSSELQWLAALRRDTDLAVPEPVPMRDGALVSLVRIEDMAQERLCLLLRWVPGRFVTSGLTPTLFERVGIFHARLHQHARHFNPPEGFVRPHRDWEQQLGEGMVLDKALLARWCPGLIHDAELLLFSSAVERIREVLSSLPKNSNYYGLVHNDLRQMSYLFCKGNVSAIGFNHCCWNYYLFDMAITLSSIEDREDEERMRQAYIHGYEVVRMLPAQYEEKLKGFTALYKLQQLHELLNSTDSSVQREHVAAYLTSLVDWLRGFIEPDVPQG